MTLEIYHQLGHQFKWNIQSFEEEYVGDGFILAPRYMKRDYVEKELDYKIRKKSIFDPQFFIPSVAIGALSSYDFHPSLVSGGFDTTEYPDKDADASARGCAEFQAYNSFNYMVIPGRYYSGMPSNFVEVQQKLFVEPFIREFNSLGVSRRILLQVVLTEDMVKDKVYANNLLNWITSIDGIEGVYLILKRTPRPKQISDPDLLLAYLTEAWS